MALLVPHGTIFRFNNRALCMLKTMDDLTRQRISLIARNAISEIDRIAVLVSSRNTTGNRGAHNNEAASESRSRHGGNTTSSNSVQTVGQTNQV